MKQVLKADGTCIMAYLLKEKEAILPPFLYYFNEDSFPFSYRMSDLWVPDRETLHYHPISAHGG